MVTYYSSHRKLTQHFKKQVREIVNTLQRGTFEVVFERVIQNLHMEMEDERGEPGVEESAEAESVMNTTEPQCHCIHSVTMNSCKVVLTEKWKSKTNSVQLSMKESHELYISHLVEHFLCTDRVQGTLP